MALARLAGDGLAQPLGPAGCCRRGWALVTAALAATLLIGEPVAAVVGFALIGVGIANAVPLLFSAAGRVPPSGPSLAAVFTVGYTGFIVGPPLIGVLADAISLPAALGVLCAAGLAVTLLGSRAADAEARRPPRRGHGGGMRFAAVLSDLDGVLVDSGAEVERIWREWAVSRGLDPDEVGRTSHGVPGVQVIERVAPELDAGRRVDRGSTRCTPRRAGSRCPGAAELLASVAPLAVVTSCTPPLAAARFSAAGLAPPAVLITADLTPRGKPHPDPYLAGARRAGRLAGATAS